MNKLYYAMKTFLFWVPWIYLLRATWSRNLKFEERVILLLQAIFFLISYGIATRRF